MVSGVLPAGRTSFKVAVEWNGAVMRVAKPSGRHASLGLAERLCDAAIRPSGDLRDAPWLDAAQRLLERIVESRGEAALWYCCGAVP